MGTPDFPGGTDTVEANPDTALDFVNLTVPGFNKLITGKRVLDYGCGFGYQSMAMARAGAASVFGLDRARAVLQERWRTIGAMGYPIEFATALQPGDRFDVVLSCSAFEHYLDPEGELRKMLAVTRPGGRVVVTFAQPWLSPYGSHMDGITKLPWVNLLFSERTMLKVRARYRPDHATSYEETEDGLCRMTVRRFERAMRESGARIELLRIFAVRRLPLVTKIPIARELLSSAAACVLVTATPG